MKIQDAINIADIMKPNMMPAGAKVLYLQELDQLIYKEILLKHVHTAAEEVLPVYVTDPEDEEAQENEGEGEGTEEETEPAEYVVPDMDLLVPDPYGNEMYMYWLMSKIDLLNQEIDKYNNDRALFENAYDTMSDWWTRTRMPLTSLPFVQF